MPPTKASKSVVASYDTSNIPSPLKISGKRPPSVLGSSQGDHVTAYRLVEEGLYRSISDLKSHEIYDLNFLKNRDSLRDKRSKLYDYISAIASLSSNNVAVDLFSQIDKLLEAYNQKRHKKSDLRSLTKDRQENLFLDDEILSSTLGEIDLKYRQNGEFLRELFTQCSQLLLSFYNKTPGSAYFAIEGFEASSSEGSLVKSAIERIKKQLIECDKIKNNSSALSTKMSNYLVPAFLQLMHYPEITDYEKFHRKKKVTETIDADTILQDHKITTDNYGLKTSEARNNNKLGLVSSIAKHIHILVAVYPEIDDIFDVNEIIEDFTIKFIKRKPFGWPKFNTVVEINDITEKVKEKFQELQNKAKDYHYTSYKEYDELVSSDDDEEITTPSPRNHKIQPGIELQQLRKYHKIISEAIKSGDVNIPDKIQKDLEKECPVITLPKPKYKLSSKGDTSGGEENESENENETDSSSQESEYYDNEPAKPKKSIKNAVAKGIKKPSKKKTIN